MTGTGSLDEDVTAANFDLEMKTAAGTVSCKGDASASKTCNLPLGTGSLTFDAVTFPMKKGSTSISVDLSLSAALPGALAHTDTTVKATGKNGDKLFCMEIKSAPAESKVHEDRAAQIKTIQNTPGVLWTAAATPRFASEAPGASKSLCGVKGDWKASVEAAIASGEVKRFQLLTAAEVPESFDSEANWPQCAKIIGDIRDQSNCGCCWAFAAAEAASDRMCIATNASKMLPLSAQDVCFGNNYDGCEGGQITTPWRYIQKSGAVSGGQYQGSGPFGKGLCSDFSLAHCHHHGPQGDDPYPAEGKPGCPSEQSPQCPSQCDATAAAPHKDFSSDKYSFEGKIHAAGGIFSGEKGVQQLIMAGGPVATDFTVYEDFANYVSGIYHHVSGSAEGGHAVKIVGWGQDNGVKYWKVANSWNPHWGEGGYFRILRGTNHCGIEDEVVATSPSSKWHQGVTPSTACEDQETESACNSLSCT